MKIQLTSIGMIDMDNMLSGVISFVKTPIGLFITLLLVAFLIVSIRIEMAKENAKKANNGKSKDSDDIS